MALRDRRLYSAHVLERPCAGPAGRSGAGGQDPPAAQRTVSPSILPTIWAASRPPGAAASRTKPVLLNGKASAAGGAYRHVSPLVGSSSAHHSQTGGGRFPTRRSYTTGGDDFHRPRYTSPETGFGLHAAPAPAHDHGGAGGGVVPTTAAAGHAASAHEASVSSSSSGDGQRAANLQERRNCFGGTSRAGGQGSFHEDSLILSTSQHRPESLRTMSRGKNDPAQQTRHSTSTSSLQESDRPGRSDSCREEVQDRIDRGPVGVPSSAARTMSNRSRFLPGFSGGLLAASVSGSVNLLTTNLNVRRPGTNAAGVKKGLGALLVGGAGVGGVPRRPMSSSPPPALFSRGLLNSDALVQQPKLPSDVDRGPHGAPAPTVSVSAGTMPLVVTFAEEVVGGAGGGAPPSGAAVVRNFSSDGHDGVRTGGRTERVVTSTGQCAVPLPAEQSVGGRAQQQLAPAERRERREEPMIAQDHTRRIVPRTASENCSRMRFSEQSARADPRQHDHEPRPDPHDVRAAPEQSFVQGRNSSQTEQKLNPAPAAPNPPASQPTQHPTSPNKKRHPYLDLTNVVDEEISDDEYVPYEWLERRGLERDEHELLFNACLALVGHIQEGEAGGGPTAPVGPPADGAALQAVSAFQPIPRA